MFNIVIWRGKMVAYLVDRIWSQTVLYIIIVASLTARSNLWNTTLFYSIIAACSAYYIKIVYTAVEKERATNRLGGRAPVRRSWVPFGIGLVRQALRAHSTNTVHLWWRQIFRETGKPLHPYVLILQSDEMIRRP